MRGYVTNVLTGIHADFQRKKYDERQEKTNTHTRQSHKTSRKYHQYTGADKFGYPSND
jgi:hypothetical protein